MFLFLKSFRYNRVLEKFLECFKNVSFHPCCWSEKETHEKSFPDKAAGSDLYLIIAESGSSELRDLSLHIHKDVDKRNVAPKIKALFGLLIFSRHNVFTHVPSHTHNYSMENTFFKKTLIHPAEARTDHKFSSSCFTHRLTEGAAALHHHRP